MSDNFDKVAYWAGPSRDEITHYAGNTPQQTLTRTPDGGQQMGDRDAWLHVANSLNEEYNRYGPEGFERRHGVSWEEVSKMIADALENAPASERPHMYLADPNRNRSEPPPPRAQMKIHENVDVSEPRHYYMTAEPPRYRNR